MIVTTPYPRCTPGLPQPSALRQRYRNFPIAKTDRAYGEIMASIRAIPKQQFTYLDIPFPRIQAFSALGFLLRNGQIKLVKVTRYHPPFQKRRYPLRHYTFVKL